MKIIALIPASLNSRKLKNKDIYNFNGHPLLAYSISSAIQSGIFSSIVCVTDNFIYGQLRNIMELVYLFFIRKISSPKINLIENG